MRQARDAGVMVAMKGTVQGRSGYYQDFDGEIYFFAIDKRGCWWQVVRANTWREEQDGALEGVAALVPVNDIKIGSEGYYEEYNDPERVGKSRRKAPRWWADDGNGYWVPSKKKKKKKEKS